MLNWRRDPDDEAKLAWIDRDIAFNERSVAFNEQRIQDSERRTRQIESDIEIEQLRSEGSSAKKNLGGARGSAEILVVTGVDSHWGEGERNDAGRLRWVFIL